MAAANGVVGSPLDRATLGSGSKKPIATCYWDGSPEECWVRSTAWRCWTGTGTRCLARLRLEDQDLGARRPATAGRPRPPHR
jgi:hypothetical protein